LLNNYFIQTESNSFTGVVPTSLGDMRQLKTLNAADNSLGGVLPSQIGGLEVLETLDLGKSRILFSPRMFK